MLLSSVDVIFADVAQPDQARIVAINAHNFLKEGGHVVISIKANCIDSTVPAEAVFISEVAALRKEKFKPLEQITLEPYERDHAMVTGKLLHCQFALFAPVLKPISSSVRTSCPVKCVMGCLCGSPWCISTFFLLSFLLHVGRTICYILQLWPFFSP